MKTAITNLFVIAVLLTGCDKNEIDFNKEPGDGDGFCIKANKKVIIDHNDFEFYDFSTHLIYLKDHKSFAKDVQNIGEFKVFAGDEVIYSGQTLPWYSSYVPSGPVIMTNPSFYGDYIVSIGFIQKTDILGNILSDPREDERIVEALKTHNQFHAGLSCEIKSVKYLSSKNVKLELLLKNNDPFNYYYLDPVKTGNGLFHYFTNGLVIRNLNPYETYTHKIEPISADSYNTWEKAWLSMIRSKESKVITITYNNFEDVPKGLYKATFEFPGLSYHVEKKDLIQQNGRIWLGALNTEKEITIK